MTNNKSGVKREPLKVDNFRSTSGFPDANWDSIMDPDWWFVDERGMMVHKGMFKNKPIEKKKYPHIFKDGRGRTTTKSKKDGQHQVK